MSGEDIDITPVVPDEDFNRRHVRRGDGGTEAQLDDLDLLANLMDSAFTIPGTSIRFGLDPLIGLLPGIGDTISLLISGYIVRRAHELGAPPHLKARMLFNIFMDWLIGIVPFAGDIFDIGWKANRRNVDLLKKHMKGKGQAGTV